MSSHHSRQPGQSGTGRAYHGPRREDGTVTSSQLRGPPMAMNNSRWGKEEAEGTHQSHAATPSRRPSSSAGHSSKPSIASKVSGWLDEKQADFKAEYSARRDPSTSHQSHSDRDRTQKDGQKPSRSHSTHHSSHHSSHHNSHRTDRPTDVRGKELVPLVSGSKHRSSNPTHQSQDDTLRPSTAGKVPTRSQSSHHSSHRTDRPTDIRGQEMVPLVSGSKHHSSQSTHQSQVLAVRPSTARTGTVMDAMPSRHFELVPRGPPGAAYTNRDFSGAMQRLKVLEDKDRQRDQRELDRLEKQVRDERKRANRAEERAGQKESSGGLNIKVNLGGLFSGLSAEHPYGCTCGHCS
ncbi:MAG: hypothetical protein M1812_003430 [Candelaria pacifica]|nr:MAG: hypothetical protein M1812_003430 [Candelaria pacifica]